ncbi:MAG TPA: hypothetical protein VMB27_22530 [Solirubrobacteraceae bacterium]|nr:hypothetical protein [Solirubrobacteraceae bacterium]
MKDSTHNRKGCRRARLVALILALTLGLLPSSALADGDPASDVLATQSLFLPQDAGISPPQQNQLSALLSSAATSGYQIRVAIIASSSDLGSVTELWRQPQTYARFLGQELSLVYHGPLLVVMPKGFGLVGVGPTTTVDPSALAGVRIGAAGGPALGTATLTAVQRLAEASGHSVPIPAATAAASGPGSNDTLPLIVFAIGAVLIVLAWAASLRARPLRARH